MIVGLVAALVLAPPATPAKVSSASLFKNGYAVVVREAPLRNGETIIENIPQATLGTLWITASDGVKLRQVVAGNTEATQMVDIQTLDGVIAANVGKTMTLKIGEATITGKILSASGTALVVETEGGISVYHKVAVSSISAGKDLVWRTSTTSTTRAFKIQADAPAGAKVYILSLERGLTWAPAYAADISGKEVLMTSKATILNDLADLDGVDVRLITGFPNLPFLNVLDPFSVAQSVDQFAGALMNMGAPGQLRSREGMAMQSNSIRDTSFGQAFDTSGMSGMQAEDLFFYTVPNVRLKKGERGYMVLFEFKSNYEHVYEWDVADQVVNDQYVPRNDRQTSDVWHSIKFKNNSKQPLTTAAAITTKDGQILGQDMVFFTNPGAETLLKITKAMDVLAESTEEEIARERKTIQWGSSSNYPVDEVTLKGTLSVRNLKSMPVKLKVTKELSGEMISADGSPRATKMAKGLQALNARQKLEWTLDLPAGERREVTYTYKLLIRR